MATHQFPVPEPEQSQPTPTIRIAGSRREYRGNAELSIDVEKHTQNWDQALRETQSWAEAEKSKNSQEFDAKWKSAKQIVDARVQSLRNLVASGTVLEGEAEILVGNSDRLRQSFLRTKESVKGEEEQ